MYKLFITSAYEKAGPTPTLSAVQHDSARVIPVWIRDLDFKYITGARVVVRKPSGRRVIEECRLAPNYQQLKTAYEDGNKEYRPFYEYYKKEGDFYTAVEFANLETGITYYRRTNTVVLVPLLSQALAECGTSIGQVQLDYALEAGGGQITTFKFFLKVEKSYIDHAVSKNERENINQLLATLEQTIAQLPTEPFNLEETDDVWDDWDWPPPRDPSWDIHPNNNNEVSP